MIACPTIESQNQATSFYDFVKLLGKETLVPSTASKAVFLAAPFAGLISVTLVSMILWLADGFGISFVGDVIVVD